MKLDKKTLKDLCIKEENITEPIKINNVMDDIQIISIGFMNSFHDENKREICVTINSNKMKWDTINKDKEKEYIINMINSID